MLTGHPQPVGRAHPRRRTGVRVTILTAVTVLVAALLAPGASATAGSQLLSSGSTMSVRSGDGCKIKPAPPSSNRQYARNFTCTITKTPGVLPVMPAAPRVATMRNGDTLSLFSIDGCKLKPAAPTSGRQYMRNYTCTGGSTPPPARASLRSG